MITNTARPIKYK